MAPPFIDLFISDLVYERFAWVFAAEAWVFAVPLQRRT
jgi:hypothetical protein